MIRINEKEIEWREGMTVSDAMNDVDISFPLVVVAVNDQIIPQRELGNYELSDGDEIKVLHLTSGG
jgi:sulfur carrier protein